MTGFSSALLVALPFGAAAALRDPGGAQLWKMDVASASKMGCEHFTWGPFRVGFGCCESCVKTFRRGEGVCKCSVLENFVLVWNKRDHSSLILSCACFAGKVICCFGQVWSHSRNRRVHQKPLFIPASMQTLDRVSFKLKLCVILVKRSSTFQRT